MHMPTRLVRTCLAVAVGILICGLSACERHEQPADGPRLAVSNSYLEAAIDDLLGTSGRCVRLAEPGTCPGHFDIRPSQVTALSNCTLLLRFDFQTSLDRKLENLVSGGLQIVPIKAPGALCDPATYDAVCEQVATALQQQHLLTQSAAQQRLAEIHARMEQLTRSVHDQVKAADLSGQRVIASAHQAELCRFLDLSVAATLGSADVASIGEIDAAVQRPDIDLVVANRPEGRGLADAVAERLGVPVIMFDNFPADGDRFDDLLQTNVDRLIAGGASQ